MQQKAPKMAKSKTPTQNSIILSAIAKDRKTAFGMKSATNRRAKFQWIDGFAIFGANIRNRVDECEWQAIQALEWGYKTGRFSADVEMMLRSLSFWRAVDLVVWLASGALKTGRQSVTQQEVVDFINQWPTLVLRYGA